MQGVMDARPTFMVKSLGRGQDPNVTWDITPKRKDLFYIPPDNSPMPTKCGKIWSVEHDAFDVVSSEFIRSNNYKCAKYSETGQKFLRKSFGARVSPAAAAATRLYADAQRKEKQRQASDAQQLAMIRRDANMSHTKRRTFVCD